MQKQNGDETLKFVKHRKLGSYHLYIYKSGEYYVLQMTYKSKDDPSYQWGKYVTHDKRLSAVVAKYNYCIEDYKLRMGE